MREVAPCGQHHMRIIGPEAPRAAIIRAYFVRWAVKPGMRQALGVVLPVRQNLWGNEL